MENGKQKKNDKVSTKKVINSRLSVFIAKCNGIPFFCNMAIIIYSFSKFNEE